MDIEDIVDTSDAEEREVLDLSEADYWGLPSPQEHTNNNLRLTGSSSPKLAQAFHPIQEDHGINRRQEDGASPRKRIKIFHGDGSRQSDNGLSPTLSASQPVFTARPSIENSSRNSVLDVTRSHVPDLIRDEEEESVPQALVRIESTDTPRSDWKSLFSSPEQHGPVISGNCVDLNAVPRFLSSRSRSLSTDPWSLFSSPLRGASTPPATSSQHSPGPSSPKPDTLQTKNTSSPLTPVSSPAHPSRLGSRSPDELQLITPIQRLRKSKDLVHSLPQDERPVISADTEVSYNRYSLRRREARQLNPYAYDKLLYKQQMRSNPDAIVRFVSPKRRSEVRQAGERDEGMQAEYAFEVGNTEEDEEYVETVGWKKSVTGMGVDEAREQNKDTGWLPEALRPLSSSDEDGDEIRKLARKARRAREKEQARVRAEAKSADAGARKARKRLRSLPVPRSSGPSNSSQAPLSPAHGLSPVFARSHSEPMSYSHPTSPSQSGTREPDGQTHRASSYSPIRDSDRRQTPEFNYDYQQEEVYQPDGDTTFPRPFHTPLPDLEPPHSPPVRTQNPNVGPSDFLPPSSPESLLEMTAADRKRFRVLKRMMPRSMIARQLTIPLPPPATRRRRVRSPMSSGSEAEEVPLIPGHARMRVSTAYRDTDIRGDPESSDIEREHGDVVALGMPSDDNSIVRVIRTHQTSRAERVDDIISLSDGSPNSSTSETQSMNSDDDDHADHGISHQWSSRPRARGPAREKSLIDWMLTRTRDPSGRQRQKSRLSKVGGKTGGQPRLDIVVGGVKRYGHHRQTMLPFSRSTPKAPVSEAHGRQMGVTSGEDQKRRRRRGGLQSSVHSIRYDGTRITSKHRGSKSKRAHDSLVIEQDDNEFHQALDPGWKAEMDRWKEPASARPPSTNISNRYRNQSLPLVAGSSCSPSGQASLVAHSAYRHISADMNIIPLPSGVKFGPSTYLGKGLLHQLVSIISGLSEVAPPLSCHSQGLKIGPTTSIAVFSALFGPLCDRLVDSLRDLDARDADKDKEWEGILRTCCQLVSWLSVHSNDEEFSVLETAIKDYSDGLSSYLNEVQPGLFSLTIHWFIIELSARLTFGNKRRKELQFEHLFKASKRLMQHMSGIELHSALDTICDARSDIETASLPCRAAELWICLVHLLHSCEDPSDVSHYSPGHQLWRVLAEMFPESSPTGAEASEEIWRMIFSLCALSQFSLHGLSTSSFRLSAAWELAATALRKIALTANPEKERHLAHRVLKKRDDYLSCVVNRCFLLWSQWSWRLGDAMVMFKMLQEIFRSRNFVNLRNESSVFMGFLEKSDLQLLSKRDPTDTVFEIFLKMVVQAVKSLNNADVDPRQQTSHVKKLLQMAVPVSPLPFSKTAPPTSHELSMLLNRFSAMAVAIHLDPTLSNVRFRISQARRCVDFTRADRNTRVACIYGVMYFATIMRHHRIPLEEALSWLTEMTDILMDECNEAETAPKGRVELDNAAKQNAMTLIQLLLGSVRRIIETQSLDKEHTQSEYPDPALLDGPWVTRVFKASTSLVTMSQTGLEIRMLVQSFLDARAKALPQVQIVPVAVNNNESQESQDEYENVFLDLNDAELLAALGDESSNTDTKGKEQTLCRVLDKSITPAIYRLVCKFMGDNELAKTRENEHDVADKWIDCWVGCANVLVQNGSKEWSLYMKLGQQSWEKIIDASWRRRVGLRFNLTLLRLDPGAYSTYKDDFVSVLLVSTVSYRTTIEHEFASVIFSLDGLRHPLLRGAPFAFVPGSRKFEISRDEYERARLRLIDAVFSNVAGCLRLRSDAESQSYVGFVVSLISAMRDIFETNAAGDKHGEYETFCREVFRLLVKHHDLSVHPRLSDGIRWGQANLRREGDGDLTVGDVPDP